MDLGTAGFWSGVPYPPARLYLTLGVMIVAVGCAVAIVHRRYPDRLLAQIASTLGVFLLIIGGIVYTVAFRGLRPWELVVAWGLSVPAIAWFVWRLNEIMNRPLALLEALGDSIKRGEWVAVLATNQAGAAGHAGAHGAGSETARTANVHSALRDVAVLVGETQRASRAVLDAAAQVAKIGATAADGADAVTAALERLESASQGNTDAARRIGDAATRLTGAARQVGGAARETLQISGAVQDRVQVGVSSAQAATERVSEISNATRDAAAALTELRAAAASATDITAEIRWIAQQTNLLALNAAIEAARAGDEGRGFAVVAQEVRNLSRRTTEALARIEGLLADIGVRTDGVDAQMTSVRAAAESGETVMRDALGVFRDLADRGERTVSLAQSVVEAATLAESLVTDLGTAAMLVIRVAESTATETVHVGETTVEQRSLMERLRTTSVALEGLARSLRDVVGRFGDDAPSRPAAA